MNPVSRENVILLFQLQEFLEINHSFTSLLDEQARELLRQVVISNFRPSSVSRGISARDDRARRRSDSAEPRSWSSIWAIDKTLFRASVRTFEKGIEALRKLLQDSSFTGATSNTSSLFTSSWSTISNPSESSSNPSGSTPNPSDSTGQTTRQTSAEETIYPHPIGPANRRPMDLNDPQVQAVITAAATAVVAQYVRDNPSQ